MVGFRGYFAGRWFQEKRRGWKTYLAQNGSRLYKGNKKSIKAFGDTKGLVGGFREQERKVKRQPRGGVGDMELMLSRKALQEPVRTL